MKGSEQLKDNQKRMRLNRQVMFYCDNELIYIHFIIAVFNYNSRESSASTHIHVTFILCYTVLYDFFALVFALIRVRKH